MEFVLDIIIVLFWLAFFLATLLGVINEYRRNKNNSDSQTPEDQLEEDDTVYLVEP